MAPGDGRRTLRVHEVRAETRDVLSLDLRAADGTALPAFTAQVHVERFTAAASDSASTVDSFVVQLRRQGRSVPVSAGVSILDALLDAGVEIDHSCRQGVCGTCATRVLAGTPLHLDPILPGRRPVLLDRMMVCVSRCAGAELVLDL